MGFAPANYRLAVTVGNDYELMRIAAQMGSLSAKSMLAKIHFSREEFLEGNKMLIEAANEGDPEAQKLLGAAQCMAVLGDRNYRGVSTGPDSTRGILNVVRGFRGVVGMEVFAVMVQQTPINPPCTALKYDELLEVIEETSENPAFRAGAVEDQESSWFGELVRVSCSELNVAELESLSAKLQEVGVNQASKSIKIVNECINRKRDGREDELMLTDKEVDFHLSEARIREIEDRMRVVFNIGDVEVDDNGLFFGATIALALSVPAAFLGDYISLAAIALPMSSALLTSYSAYQKYVAIPRKIEAEIARETIREEAIAKGLIPSARAFVEYAIGETSHLGDIMDAVASALPAGSDSGKVEIAAADVMAASNYFFSDVPLAGSRLSQFELDKEKRNVEDSLIKNFELYGIGSCFDAKIVQLLTLSRALIAAEEQLHRPDPDSSAKYSMSRDEVIKLAGEYKKFRDEKFLPHCIARYGEDRTQTEIVGKFLEYVEKQEKEGQENIASLIRASEVTEMGAAESGAAASFGEGLRLRKGSSVLRGEGRTGDMSKK